jgi:hypothetical protein
MAKKKRKGRRPAATVTSRRPASEIRRPAPADGGADTTRRARKADVRAARERFVRRQSRRAAVRRAFTFLVLGTGLLGALYLVNRAAAPKPLPAAAVAAASAADCSALQTPAADAPGGLHLQPGASYSYSEHPATSGYHDPSALPGQPRVYTSPVQETQAVHSLEHGSVIMYYRSSGEGALEQDVVSALGPVANDNHATYLIPHDSLPDGAALAVTAWNKLMTCPATITADQAVAISQGFVDAYACTSNAPEGNNGDGC